MPSDPNATWRVRIAFASLVVVFAAGAYLVTKLGKLQDGMAARERQTALQAVTDPKQIEAALRQHPQNRLLQTIAAATRAAVKGFVRRILRARGWEAGIRNTRRRTC